MEELDDLFKQAKIAFHSLNAAKTARKATAIPLPQDTNALFTDPANWERKRGLALIHAETGTLLGNFSEYLHKTGARKLVREAEPISIAASETVSGSWWLPATALPEEKRADFVKRSITLPLHLDTIGIHSVGAQVDVYLAPTGGVARVELAAETLFTGTKNAELVWLPASTNVLPAMSHDSKMAVRNLL
tara:strand:+ start:2142 stop:2711 length:570 start_codon:yes stop_codon:yes gene_type:complete